MGVVFVLFRDIGTYAIQWDSERWVERTCHGLDSNGEARRSCSWVLFLALSKQVRRNPVSKFAVPWQLISMAICIRARDAASAGCRRAARQKP